jgi:hypothetical protein
VFESEAQRARVCRVLCERARLGGMWTGEGPTEEAVLLLQRDGGPLSSGERIVLLVAFAVWSGEGKVLLDDVVCRLDQRNLHAIGTLMAAVANGGCAIEQWILRMECPGNA